MTMIMTIIRKFDLKKPNQIMNYQINQINRKKRESAFVVFFPSFLFLLII